MLALSPQAHTHTTSPKVRSVKARVAVLHLADETGSQRAAAAIALVMDDELPAIPRWDGVQALWTVLDAQQASG